MNIAPFTWQEWQDLDLRVHGPWRSQIDNMTMDQKLRLSRGVRGYNDMPHLQATVQYVRDTLRQGWETDDNNHADVRSSASTVAPVTTGAPVPVRSPTPTAAPTTGVATAAADDGSDTVDPYSNYDPYAEMVSESDDDTRDDDDTVCEPFSFKDALADENRKKNLLQIIMVQPKDIWKNVTIREVLKMVEHDPPT